MAWLNIGGLLAGAGLEGVGRVRIWRGGGRRDVVNWAVEPIVVFVVYCVAGWLDGPMSAFDRDG